MPPANAQSPAGRYDPATRRMLSFHDVQAHCADGMERTRLALISTACIESIDALEPAVLAFAFLNLERAREAADECDAATSYQPMTDAATVRALRQCDALADAAIPRTLSRQTAAAPTQRHRGRGAHLAGNLIVLRLSSARAFGPCTPNWRGGPMALSCFRRLVPPRSGWIRAARSSTKRALSSARRPSTCRCSASTMSRSCLVHTMATSRLTATARWIAEQHFGKAA